MGKDKPAPFRKESPTLITKGPPKVTTGNYIVLKYPRCTIRFYWNHTRFRSFKILKRKNTVDTKILVSLNFSLNSL